MGPGRFRGPAASGARPGPLAGRPGGIAQTLADRSSPRRFDEETPAFPQGVRTSDEPGREAENRLGLSEVQRSRQRLFGRLALSRCC